MLYILDADTIVQRPEILADAATGDLLIPQAAVSRDPKGNATVMVVGAKGAAEPRQIVTTQTVGDKWLVSSGLKPGEQVIVEGLQKVQPGAPVKPAVITAPAAQ